MNDVIQITKNKHENFEGLLVNPPNDSSNSDKANN